MEKLTLTTLTPEDLKQLIREVLAEQPSPVNKTVVAPEERMLTVEEASKYLSIAKGTMYKFIHENKIPHYKPTGKRVYFKRSELEQWVSKHRIKTNEEIEKEAMDYIMKRK